MERTEVSIVWLCQGGVCIDLRLTARWCSVRGQVALLNARWWYCIVNTRGGGQCFCALVSERSTCWGVDQQPARTCGECWEAVAFSPETWDRTVSALKSVKKRSIIGWACDSACPNKMSRRGHNWWPRGWKGGRRGERWPLEPSRWRTSMGAMATALMKRWFGGVGLADGRESRTQTCGEAKKKLHGGLLFKYHLVFITQTYTRALAACLQLHHFFCTLVFPQALRD